MMSSVVCNNLGSNRTTLDTVTRWISYSVACVIAFVRDCVQLLGAIAEVCKLWRRRPHFGRAFPYGGASSALDLTEETKGSFSWSDIYELVAEDMLILDKNLKSIVGPENPILMSATEHIFGAGGKRIRPALVFLVSRATAKISGLKDLTQRQRTLAEVVELIHTASLIHDDIIDESNLRRGKETIHKLYGTRMAILAGDFLLAKSTMLLAKLQNFEIIKLLSQVMGDLTAGEIKQESNLFDCDVQLEEYLIKSHYKTGSLMAASAQGAAMVSDGVSGDVIEQMCQYGRNLGLCYQVVDDILDFTQSAQQLGKPAGSDMAQGILTGPVIFALQKEPKLRDLIESKFDEVGSLEEAIRIVESSGGIDRARELARELSAEALQNLLCLPTSPFRVALARMVDYNLERII